MQRLFGTDGIRTRFGKEPLTPISLEKLGRALGIYLVENKRIAIAGDTRQSYNTCKSALTKGLLERKFRLDDYGILPTPALFQLIKEKNYDVGIMITASHNPACDNGIKILTPTGKLSEQAQQMITKIFYADFQAKSKIPKGTLTVCTNGNEWYTDLLKTRFKKNFLKGIKIVVDCANGAYSTLAPAIFESFGATVIPLNASPDGNNINKDCGSLYPQKMQMKVIQEKAHCGFAFDGDGDRVVAATREGYLKDGDDILALLATHPRYKNESVVSITLMSNEGLVQYFDQQNIKALRTSVGDHHVIEQLKNHHAVLGGEVSGHIIMSDFGFTSDGLYTALMITETLLLTDNWDMTTFKKFPHFTMNLPVKEKKDLNQKPFNDLIDYYWDSLNGGRILVRYSGTEPVLRVMVEAQEQAQAELVCHALCSNLSRMLET